mmetsp:Transcript_7627/g.10861  ORF Transcript_7627/g.10861 Transcript_7627/m.10861 type:complete len:293 (-) Transcript_7627:205-1083(-)
MKLSSGSFTFIAIVASCLCSTLAYAPVRTKVTQEWYQTYRSNLPSDYNIVANGGWYSVEKRATEELASRNFKLIRSSLPSEKLNPVAAGGWNQLETLAADPKGELVNMIVNGLKQSKAKRVEFVNGSARIVALCNLLQAQGKGFDSELVKGEWCSVLNIQGKKSPSFQKTVGKGEKAGLSFSNFDTDSMTFNGNVKLIFGQGDLRSTVAYKPVSANFDMINGKLVLRRISADIVDASWKFWKLPRIKIPLRAKDGYLDFLYMDKDMRITRGNRGGLFIHFRPAFLESVLAEA